MIILVILKLELQCSLTFFIFVSLYKIQIYLAFVIEKTQKLVSKNVDL